MVNYRIDEEEVFYFQDVGYINIRTDRPCGIKTNILLTM